MSPRATGAAALALAIAGAGMACARQSQARDADFAAPDLSARGVRALAAGCAQCHGTDGRPAQGSAMRPLAGRSSEAIRTRLIAFKRGVVPATVMHQIAAGYSDAELAALAAYFAKQRR